MLTPSNANTSGPDHFGWWVEHAVAEPIFVRPPTFCPASDNYTITPLVTAASAQAAIDTEREQFGRMLVEAANDRDAEKARADRLAKALEPFIEDWAHLAEVELYETCENQAQANRIIDARAALQQETQP